jgi:membrane associated rhomboid family serine protease
MIPIRDDNPTHHAPHFTIGLIVVNVVVFLFQATMSEQAGGRFVWKYGFIPAKLTHGANEFAEKLPEHAPVVSGVDRWGRVRSFRQEIPIQAATSTPAWVSMFTCMFLHGGWMHLIGNMLYLWIFGNNIEDKLGPALFGVFYIGTGVIANLAHTFFEMSWIPLVGASGAISGVMGGYVLLFPRSRILALVPIGYYMTTIKLPAWIFLLVYFVLQNLLPATFGGGGPVAYWAHIGGFVGGVALIYLFPHRRVPAAARARPIDDDDADFVL